MVIINAQLSMDFNCSIPTLVNFNASTDISGAMKAGVHLSTSVVLLESNVIVLAISDRPSPKSASLQITGFFSNRDAKYFVSCT